MVVMEEIRRLWSEGMSSSELIRVGYAPGTVYKVQRQMRRRCQGRDKEATKSMRQTTTVDERHLVKIKELETENDGLEGWVELLQERLDEQDSLGSQLKDARGRIQKLEAEVERKRALEEQVRTLESHNVATERAVLSLERWSRKALETSSETGFGKLAMKLELSSLVAEALGYKGEHV